VAYSRWAPVARSICQIDARPTSAWIPFSVILLLEPTPA
jgi:hypothetical protein